MGEARAINKVSGEPVSLQARDLPCVSALWDGEPSTPKRGLEWESTGEAPDNIGESREWASNQDPSNCHVSQLHQLGTHLSWQLGPDLCSSHHLRCTSVPRYSFQNLPAVLLSSVHWCSYQLGCFPLVLWQSAVSLASSH